MKAFISYSHRDEPMLDRLHAHLAMLRREGGISEWYDRQISAGASIDREIAKQLDGCQVFVALVSPDFLSSKYCYEKEMTRAIERHEVGEILIIPVILEPCDWQASPLRAFKAVPRDGKPISEWTNKNAAWLDVVTELRRLVQMPRSEDSRADRGNHDSPDRSTRTPSKYRLKQTFDEVDRADFRRSAFETVQNFFERSCAEIDGIEGLRGRYESMGPGAFTCTVINRLIKSGRGGTAHITVRAGSHSMLGDISWSFSARASYDTANGSFNIVADDYHQFLRGTFFYGADEGREMSPDEAASRLWQEFIEQAGISV
jgi:hypothetical protein